jgi:tRNA dimethylallyltransferase
MAETRQRVVVIVGPTASGKSDLAVALARRFGGEVISGDSRQVYRGLTIGTGKITAREMRGIPHHLLDVASPKRTFTANDFVQRGREALQQIEKRKAIPFVCGGTGFYIDALLGRVTLADTPPNKALRTQLAPKSAGELYALLAKLDPIRARSIDKHNKRRLARAIEIARAQPRPKPRTAPRLEVLWIGLRPPRETLRERINTRLKKRIKSGMRAEAVRLHAGGLSFERMDALGLEYRFLARLLRRELTRGQFEEQLAAAIWQFAKRQLTYWRRNHDIHWFESPHDPRIVDVVAQWVQNSR